MSLGYRAVGWNRQKRRYDLTLMAGWVLFLGVFVACTALANPHATVETYVIRAFGAAAYFLLHVILCIGPLCRIDRRFLPLLYNRRHLGVTMFLTGLVHGVFSILQFHSFGDENPLVSVFSAGAAGADGLAWFPFQPLGFAALVILFLMAATSHDFWLANLGAATWKALHMGVYVAWALLVGHVVLGALQSEPSSVPLVLVGAGIVLVLGLHLVAGFGERAGDRERLEAGVEGFVRVSRVGDIQENRARVVSLGAERVAVFRYDGKVSAVSNACRHQSGPLGEGRVIDGCITCPWHGYQYRPEDGCSPPPFTERVATYRVRVVGDEVFVHPEANPPGTPVPPARIGAPSASASAVDSARTQEDDPR